MDLAVFTETVPVYARCEHILAYTAAEGVNRLTGVEGVLQSGSEKENMTVYIHDCLHTGVMGPFMKTENNEDILVDHSEHAYHISYDALNFST